MKIRRLMIGFVATAMLGLGQAAIAAPGEAAGAAPAPDYQLTAADDGRQFTLVAAGSNAKALLDDLSKKSGWKIEVAPEPQRRVTVTLTDETFERVLIAIAQSIGYVPARVYQILPKKDGDALPDHFKLPLGLPTASLTVADAPLATVVNVLKDQTKTNIEVIGDVKGDVSVAVNQAPLPDILDGIAQQAKATWTLAYRLTPAGSVTNHTRPGAVVAPPVVGDGNAEDAAARAQMQQWMGMTPAQRKALATKQIGDILRANPKDRQQEINNLGQQLGGLLSAVRKMTPAERARIAPAITDRVGPYLQALNQLTPAQKGDFNGIIRRADYLSKLVQSPAQGQGGVPPFPGGKGH